MTSHQPSTVLNITHDEFYRWQEVSLTIEQKQVTVMNIYIPHRNLSTHSIYRRLESLIRDAGEFREPIDALFSDLTAKIKSLEHNLLVVGGDFNVDAHHEAYSQLLLATKVSEVNQLNDMQDIPTYKRSKHQLDKILISEGLFASRKSFHIAPFDLIFSI